MTARPKPPTHHDENPELDDAFFAKAKPAQTEAALVRRFAPAVRPYRAALEDIVSAHDQGASLEEAIAKARVLLKAAE